MSEELPPDDGRPDSPANRGLNVCREPCDRCLFGKRPHIPWLPDGKVKVKAILKMGSHFACHEHNNVMCHGYYKMARKKLWYIGLAERLNAINWIGGTT